MVGFDILRRNMSVEAVKEVVGKTESTAGFVRPETWEEFVGVLRERPRIGRLPRSEYTESVYAIYNWILKELSTDSAGVIEKKLGGRRIAITPNDFEYDWLFENVNRDLLKQGKKVGHFCLWNSEGEMNNEEIEDAIGNIFPDISEWAWFVNLPKDQSVKTIWHAQIFAVMDVDDKRPDASPHRIDLRWLYWAGRGDTISDNQVLLEENE